MKTTRSTNARLCATALLLLPLAGACDEDGLVPGGDGPAAEMSLYLVDAPGDVDSVWVQIDDVVLVGEQGRISLLAAPTALLNLTALRDSVASLAEGVPLDSGTYREVRLLLGGAVLQAKSGEVYTTGGAEHPHGLAATGQLQCPSCSQTGIKIKLPGEVTVAEGSNGLLLDFDVGQSFGHVAGNSGKWVMHPVIHASEREPEEMDDDDDDERGEIEGVVMLGLDENGDTLVVPECGGAPRTLAAFVPTATTTTLTDDAGNFLTFAGETESEDEGFEFEIRVMDLDTFTLSYLAETALDGARLVWEATVAPASVVLTGDDDEVDDVVYTVTAARCEAP